MPGLKTLFGVPAAALALIAVPGLAAAQTPSASGSHTFSVNVLGGLGGSIDEDRPGFGNPALQLGLSVITESGAKVSGRIGTLGFGSNDALGRLFDVDLSYVTVAGEYTFDDLGYESGLFFGVGAYRLEGRRLLTGQPVSTSTFGVTLGASGQFDLSKRVDLLAELGAHLLPDAEAQVFVTGLVGLSIHVK